MILQVQNRKKIATYLGQDPVVPIDYYISLSSLALMVRESAHLAGILSYKTLLSSTMPRLFTTLLLTIRVPRPSQCVQVRSVSLSLASESIHRSI